VDCRGTAQLGLPGAPIVVRAEVERSVKLKGDGALVPLRLEGCAHWIVEGLVLTNEHRLDVPSGVDVGSVALVLESRDVTLRRLLMASSNNARHSHLLRLLHSENVLVEECEAYDFYHNAFEAVRTDRITFRRNYLHSRYAAAAGAYSGSGMRGEVGIQIEESRDALLENNLAEVVVNGFAVVGRHARSPFDEPPPYPPGGARMYGNLVRDSLGFGFRIESRCEAADPCELPERLASSTQVVDGVVFEAAGGVSIDAAPETRISNVTAARVTNGFHLLRGAGNLGARYAASVTHSLTRGFNGVGFWAGSADEWQFERCATQSPGLGAVSFSPLEKRFLEPLEAADDDACVAYLGAASSLRGAGGSGSDIGANVLYRTVDGALTGEPLWESVLGSFPCGAIVPGLNDDPSQSCSGAHERFRVGTPECPLSYAPAP